jgi:hypothetical protein
MMEMPGFIGLPILTPATPTWGPVGVALQNATYARFY